MLKKFRNSLLSFLQLIILVYFFLLAFLYFYQRNLMYHPDENNYFNDKLSVNIEEVEISTQDGLALLGWYHEKDIMKNKTILFFHGNAGSLENRILSQKLSLYKIIPHQRKKVTNSMHQKKKS